MKLPRRNQAYVPEQKLRAYLLSPTHPVGQSKARFFRAHGYEQSNADQLRRALLALARTEDVEETEQTPHGTKYVVAGSLAIPQGGEVAVRTVWIIEAAGSDAPRFVTAYPA